jgi:hypothetical protein
VWFFQHQPNDQWDYDWAFERQVLPLPVNGRTKPVVVTGGKQAIFDAMEADTGKYVFSFDLGVQNVVKAVDPATGAKTIDASLGARRRDHEVHVSARRRRQVVASIVVQPTHPHPVRHARRGVHGPDAGRAGWARQPLHGSALEPASAAGSDGKYGRVQAISLDTRKTVWMERQRAPQSTGALATAGGVVFAGALDRSLIAYDDMTGKELWRTRWATCRATPHQLRGERPAVPGGRGRQRRRAGQHVPGARAGNQEPTRPGRGGVRVRAAEPHAPVTDASGFRFSVAARSVLVPGSWSVLGPRSLVDGLVDFWRSSTWFVNQQD